MKHNPSPVQAPNLPVYNVAWQEALEFIRGLNSLEKTQKYRLPTEAEWEYACRAGTETIFFWGDDPLSKKRYAWFSLNSKGQPQNVASLQPNPWGLYDMLGNVDEWCSDTYDANYYKKSPRMDPLCRRDRVKNRVYRGGNVFSLARDIRCGYRNYIGENAPRTSNDRNIYQGIRLARDAD